MTAGEWLQGGLAILTFGAILTALREGNRSDQRLRWANTQERLAASRRRDYDNLVRLLREVETDKQGAFWVPNPEAASICRAVGVMGVVRAYYAGDQQAPERAWLTRLRDSGELWPSMTAEIVGLIDQLAYADRAEPVSLPPRRLRRMVSWASGRTAIRSGLE